MKQKTLNDFPEYERIQTAVGKLRSEKNEISARLEQITFELSQPREQQVDGVAAWAEVLEGKDSYRYGVDTRAELRDEQIQLEARVLFLDDVLAVGEMELDATRGRFSVELCRQIRPSGRLKSRLFSNH